MKKEAPGALQFSHIHSLKSHIMQNSNVTLMWLSPISELPNCPNSFACSTYHSVCVFQFNTLL